MKKIILFICLFVGINVQGQILGGYVTNSVLTNSYVPYSGATKSVNLGSQILRTTGASTLGSLYVPGAITATGSVSGGSLTTAGTLSVGSTATVNALVVKSQSLATGITVSVDPTGNVFPFIVDASGGGGNAELIGQGSTNSRVTLKNTTTNQRWFLTNNTATTGAIPYGFAIGTSSDPNSGIIKTSTAGVVTLTNSTNILGTTTVISQASVSSTFPSSTYTLANRNDDIFSVRFGHGSYNPAGGATTYYGENSSGTPQTVATYGSINIPVNATLIGGNVTVLCGGAGGAGSTTLSVRVDNSTNLTFLSTVTHSAATGVQTFSVTGLTGTVNANSYINIQQVTPSWSVAPTGVFTGGVLWFRQR